MIGSNIMTYPHLTEALLREIKDLEKKCWKVDAYRVRNYWHILKDPSRWQPGDFFYREKEELLGYLGYYIFQPGVMDVMAMVAPKARRQGIFKQLWQQLRWLTKRFDIHTYRFPCDPNAKAIKTWLAAQSAEYLHTEYHMLKKNTSPLPEKIPELSLERVDASFVEMISEFDVACFHADFNRAKQRYTENFTMAHRQAWMVKLNNEYIGKIHLRFDANCVFLHDICVLPQFQHQGYGAEALRRMGNHLILGRYRQLGLDVETKNKRALNLYLKNGFVISEAYEYYQIKG